MLPVAERLSLYAPATLACSKGLPRGPQHSPDARRMNSIGTRDIRLHLAISKPLECFLALRWFPVRLYRRSSTAVVIRPPYEAYTIVRSMTRRSSGR